MYKVAIIFLLLLPGFAIGATEKDHQVKHCGGIIEYYLRWSKLSRLANIDTRHRVRLRSEVGRGHRAVTTLRSYDRQRGWHSDDLQGKD